MTSDAGSASAEGRLAARLETFAGSLADDERAVLTAIMEQATAHPEAILRRTDESEVRGFHAATGFFRIGAPPPPPPGGAGVTGGGGYYYNYAIFKYY